MTSNAMVNNKVAGPLDFLYKAPAERSGGEMKAKHWWEAEAKPGAGVQLGESVASKLAKHIQKYVVETYFLTTDGMPSQASVTLGVLDDVWQVLGVPLIDGFDETRKAAQREIANVMARLFPRPLLDVKLTWRRVDMTNCLNHVLGHDTDSGAQMVVVVTNITATRKLVHAQKQQSWAVAAQVTLDGQDVLCSLVPSAGLLLQFDENSAPMIVKGTKTLVKAADIGLVPVGDVRILEHAVIRASFAPDKAARGAHAGAAAALFRCGAFQLPVLFNDKVFDLSMFNIWALLRTRSCPSQLLTGVAQPRTNVYLACGDDVDKNLLPASLSSLETLPGTLPDAKATILYCVAVNGFVLETLVTVHEDIQLVLLDTDPKRLHETMCEVLDGGLANIRDVGLFDSSASLCDALSARGIGQAGSSILGTAKAPRPGSDEAREAVRKYLAGHNNNSVLGNDDLVAIGTSKRLQATYLHDQLLQACANPAQPVVAHAVVPGAGTSTLVNLAARQLRQSGAWVAVVNADDAACVTEAARLLQEEACPPENAIFLCISHRHISAPKPLLVSLQKLQTSAVHVKAAILTVLLHPIGDGSVPWASDELVLNPSLQPEEVGDFLSLYKTYYPERARLLDALKDASKTSCFVGLPGLIATEGQHTSCSAALEALLAKYDPFRNGLSPYLAVLAVLELFALGTAGYTGIPVPFRGPPFNSDWDWLLEQPGSVAHRLHAAVWAVPVLRQTVGLLVTLSASAKGLRVTKDEYFLGVDGVCLSELAAESVGDGTTAVSEGAAVVERLLSTGFLQMVAQRASLHPWLQLKKSRQGLSRKDRLPMWVAVVGEARAKNLLEGLVEKWPKVAFEDAALSRSYAQGCILLSILSEPPRRSCAHDWQPSIAWLTLAVDKTEVKGVNYLARFDRVALLGRAAVGLSKDSSVPDAWVREFASDLKLTSKRGLSRSRDMQANRLKKLCALLEIRARGMDKQNPYARMLAAIGDVEGKTPPTTPHVGHLERPNPRADTLATVAPSLSVPLFDDEEEAESDAEAESGDAYDAEARDRGADAKRSLPPADTVSASAGSETGQGSARKFVFPPPQSLKPFLNPQEHELFPM